MLEKRTASHRGIKPAKEHMQEYVQQLKGYMSKITPFNEDGTPRLEGGHLALFLQFSDLLIRACAMLAQAETSPC